MLKAKVNNCVDKLMSYKDKLLNKITDFEVDDEYYEDENMAKEHSAEILITILKKKKF